MVQQWHSFKTYRKPATLSKSQWEK